MRNKVVGSAFLTFPALLAACSPVSKPEAGSAGGAVAADVIVVPASSPPSDWRRVSFVSGLSVAAPPSAAVAYPQGEDSRLLEISGQDFRVSFDDYGPFAGNGTLRLAGRPADETTRTRGDCRQRVVRIELPQPASLVSCMPEDRQCRVPNAKVVMNSLCKGAAACGTVDTVIGSTQLASGPHAPFPRPDPNWRPPEQPLCRVDQ